jgi:hypothetical protein
VVPVVIALGDPVVVVVLVTTTLARLIGRAVTGGGQRDPAKDHTACDEK